MTDDVNTGANAGSAGSGGPGPEPASGPVSGTPRFSRPLLPRVKRDSVVTFVNETLDAVDQLADKLADAVGLRGTGGTGATPPAPPAPTPPPPPEPPGAAAPPPPPPL